MSERESMPVDVVIVGAGPAGLSAAIRLKQVANETGQDISIVVLEKSAEIGGHILSGAVIDPIALNQLIPDWQEQGAPVKTQVSSDQFTFLSETGSIKFPNFLLPPLFSNHGNYIISLGELCGWLAEQAEAMGVDIFPGFAASEILMNEDGSVKGVATADMGRAKDGSKKPEFTPGMELHAKYTLIAEGARGSLAKTLIDQFKLDENSSPQKYGIGIKEIWRVKPENHRLGHVEHTMGWPLDKSTGGGGFIYHNEGDLVTVGFTVHLDYENPYLSPFDEMQRLKTHPHIAKMLEGGERIAFGARAMTSGGWQSIPNLAFPGGALIGCAAGFMNLPRIKGSHNAMLSGMKVAERIAGAIAEGRENDKLENLNQSVTDGDIERDLFKVRNVKPLWGRYSTMLATMLAGIDMWTNTLLGFSFFGTLKSSKADSDALKEKSEFTPIEYPKPDGKLTFDRSSSVHLANIAHDENQPVHLTLRNQEVPISHNLALFDEPAQRYCPAGVYEITEDEGKPALRINAANCVHCKTCDIKDPSQNIDWIPPEGGSGPNYQNM